MRDVNEYIEAIGRRLSLRKSIGKDRPLPNHFVVIESDDWGSIRMPSTDTLECLKSKGYKFFDYNGYDKYDTLASNTDIEMLMDVLSSVHDCEGRPAKLTMNCVVANPDFDKIKASGYKEYHYELFTETLRRYPHHDRSFLLWQEGIKQGILRPQFHGREHLNVLMWLKLLQNGVKQVVDSFDYNVISMMVDIDNDSRNHTLAAFHVGNEDEYAFVRKAVSEGLDIFEQLFGYRSLSMIAPNYTWDTVIEDEAAASGVRYIQGSRYQRHSEFILRNGGNRELRYIGQKNSNGQLYTIRNCSFEPSEYASKNADSCMAEIDKLFKRRIPAIISCHRQNFIGELYPDNRDNNLKEFKRLLNTIIKKYSDVLFLSSDELGKVLEH